MNEIDIPTEEQAKAAMLAVPPAALLMRTAGDCVVKRMLANRQVDREVMTPELARHEAKIRTLARMYGSDIDRICVQKDADTRWAGFVAWDASDSSKRQSFYEAILTGFSFCLTTGEHEWVVVSRATFIYTRMLDVFKPVDSFADDKLQLVGELACGAAVYLPVVGGSIDLFVRSHTFITGVGGVAAIGCVNGSLIHMATAADRIEEQIKAAEREREQRVQGEMEVNVRDADDAAPVWRALQPARHARDERR